MRTIPIHDAAAEPTLSKRPGPAIQSKIRGLWNALRDLTDRRVHGSSPPLQCLSLHPDRSGINSSLDYLPVRFDRSARESILPLELPYDDGQYYGVANSRRGRRRHCSCTLMRTKDGTDRPITYLLRPATGLPVDVWWTIIDHLQGNWSALLTCTKVCRAWHAHAQLYLPRGDGAAVEIFDHGGVAALLQFRLALLDGLPGPPRAVRLCGCHQFRSLAHVGMFAAKLSGQLPWLESLHFQHGDWESIPLDERLVIPRLSSFTTIRRLRLDDITLPSTTTFVQLLCALPKLYYLACVDVSTRSKHYGYLLNMPAAPLCKLEEVVLDRADEDIFYVLATMELGKSCRAVELGVPTILDPNDTDNTNYYARFIQSLPLSMNSLTIVVHDTDLSHEALVLSPGSLSSTEALPTVHQSSSSGEAGFGAPIHARHIHLGNYLS
ncbi:hypothetical protein DAEQUDRAFT_447149 [Daedalea quercina L-15889]|uniref:F-box domain-containing protein n=1 Tax=Daedalea quercina L-15889 TaxID=1314783 RepID=A0A165N591_9APHY|nr:hypothetical protein DAEQUDRAFT_447149 [Daedalea quercina L-15889]